ncbi:hypothetical protein ACJMK2_026726 [Sinanodonta woodiana]|uniref:Cartilage intermediate layer protein 1/2 C-terminal domain-containing protein n=1 Tax=Sinanodonta woodiana TaxID=1069815 RepID=A0ABD3XP52_SINWO
MEFQPANKRYQTQPISFDDVRSTEKQSMHNALISNIPVKPSFSPSRKILLLALATITAVGIISSTIAVIVLFLKSGDTNVAQAHQTVYGVWTTWSSWNGCSASCGGGIQSRTRLCQKTQSVLDCVGAMTQSQICNSFNCPDCSHMCNIGILSDDCDRCVCSAIVANRIVDGENFPLSGVSVAEAAHPYNILAESDSSGTFTLNSSCPGTEIVLRKEKYQDKTVTISTKNVVITMEHIFLPYIISHPHSEYRLSGENVTICCIAGGGPGNSSSSSIASVPEIIVPPNSYIIPNGSRYDGTVSASPTFLDPTNLTILENIPGVFQFTDNEGNTQNLDTLGVFGLFLRDNNENPLTIDGTVDMFLSSDILASNPNAGSEYKIWGLSEITGKWEVISSNSKSKRRTPQFEVSKLNKYIYLTFPIFRDKEAVTQDGSTMYPQQTCHEAICNGDPGILEIYHYDYTTYGRETLIPANTSISENIGIDKAAQNLIGYKVSDNGRVLSLKFNSSNNGPFYKNLQTCMDSMSVSNHFRFYLSNTDPDVYTYLHTIAPKPGNQNIAALVWYPEFAAKSFSVCYIRLSVNFAHGVPQDPIKLRVVSYGGTNVLTKGTILGIREVQLWRNNSICIEYKCSGKLQQFVPGVDFTKLKIFPLITSGRKCNINVDNLADTDPPPNKNNVGLSVYENYAPDFYNSNDGVFQSSTDSNQI